MGDINRDPELDRQPPDPRTAGERVSGASSDSAEAADGGGSTTTDPHAQGSDPNKPPRPKI